MALRLRETKLSIRICCLIWLAIVPLVGASGIYSGMNCHESFHGTLNSQYALYHSAEEQHINREMHRLSSMDSVNAYWQLFVRDESRSKNLSRLVGFLEAKLSIAAPDEFVKLFTDGQWHEGGDFQLNRSSLPNVDSTLVPPSELSVGLENKYFVNVIPPESMKKGKIELILNEESIWTSELWSPSLSVFGRSINSAISTEVVESFDEKTVYVFGAHIEGFYIVGFDKLTGKRQGAFISKKPFK